MTTTLSESNFDQVVLTSSVPVLVHFWAPWCGLCRMLNPLLDQFQREWGNQLKIVDVNADENFKLATAYQLTSLPTLLFIEDGQVIQRVEGLRGREEFRQALNLLMYRHQLESHPLENSLAE
jgi:thioredoxin 1